MVYNVPMTYEEANKECRRLKGRLTRAKNSGHPKRILDEVAQAYAQFDKMPAWPDNWALWERAKDDAEYELRRIRAGI